MDLDIRSSPGTTSSVTYKDKPRTMCRRSYLVRVVQLSPSKTLTEILFSSRGEIVFYIPKILVARIIRFAVFHRPNNAVHQKPTG